MIEKYRSLLKIFRGEMLTLFKQSDDWQMHDFTVLVVLHHWTPIMPSDFI